MAVCQCVRSVRDNNKIYKDKDGVVNDDLVNNELLVNGVPSYLKCVRELGVAHTPRVFLDSHIPNHGRDKGMEPAVAILGAGWEIVIRNLPRGLPCGLPRGAQHRFFGSFVDVDNSLYGSIR